MKTGDFKTVPSKPKRNPSNNAPPAKFRAKPNSRPIMPHLQSQSQFKFLLTVNAGFGKLLHQLTKFDGGNQIWKW